MARSRIDIQESLQDLEHLAEQHRGTPLERRITMLQTLKNEPFRPFSEIGGALGSSERTIQRWWGAYEKGGVEELLRMGQRGGKRPRRIDDEALRVLREKIAREGFSELKEAQQWLQEQFGISYSRSGTWHLMRSAAGAVPRGWMLLDEPRNSSPSVSPIASNHSQNGLSGDIIRFLNSLSTSNNVLEWGAKFRESLQLLLGDVDRVSVNVNLECPLSKPQTFVSLKAITQVKGEETASAIVVSRTETTQSARLLETIRQQGWPIEQYHSPYTYDYYYEGKAYLGTIFLWRELRNDPTSDKTIETITILEPFLIFVLSDLVARHQAEKPIDRVFYAALSQLVKEASLSPQEERIMIMQLMGHAYKEMADILNISIDTVKKHFKQIHRKTGTRGQAELFAKYFTSRLVPEELRESTR